MKAYAMAIAAWAIAARAIAAGVLALSAAPPARAQSDPPGRAQSDNVIQRLEDCVVREAARLEPSGEAADIVADAAVSRCGTELTQATPEAGFGRSNLGPRMQLKEAMRETALLQIVEVRAARNTPAPAPPPAPKPARRKKR